MPKRTDIQSILILGAGPIVIGQACEFDYSGTQACRVLRQEGYRIILVNSNPATIMTDPELADATYIEPIEWHFVEKVIAKERPDAILPTMGGQTALNCALDLAREGVLDRYDVELIGATQDAIDKAENRERFAQAMQKIGLEMPRAKVVKSLEEARQVREKFGFPIIVRPSFTLGGSGGGIAYDHKQFEAICAQGFELSPTHELLLDESIIGWKEYEMEVVRDKNDNCIIICSIENVDPMGIHTGDSITVAPAQTLTDKEYQRMRDASLAVLREIGVETGGSNVQFAINPKDGAMVVIEMNPRVSRSSALASKATGFPIAKVAAKLAVGYTLDELSNEITGGRTPASFEPTIDYVVTKVPRFTFEKFPTTAAQLTTQMKSVGEVMAIGRTFRESLQKALRGLEIGVDGLVPQIDLSAPSARSDVLKELNQTGPKRLWSVADGFRLGFTAQEIYELTYIDPWYLDQIAYLVSQEARCASQTLETLSAEAFFEYKRDGFSDSRLATLMNVSEAAVRARRYQLGIHPVYKRVDTCAAEFATDTTYLYSTYEQECEANPSGRDKVVVLGSGPNRIGQGIEFDYCCVHAAMAIRDLGYETIMVNCNPETVSTDYDISDRLYFESLTLEDVLEIVRIEHPKGVVVQYGGQTPLKLVRALEAEGVPILGTAPDAIDQAEDRERFTQLVDQLNLLQPPNGSVRSPDKALERAQQLGYPLMVRPSYVLGGRAMQIVYNELELKQYLKTCAYISPEAPLLLDRFLDDAIEVDVDAVCDGRTVLIGGIMEHIEQAGVHSGDSACCLPAHSLSDAVLDELRRQIIALAKTLNVVGLVNAQFAIQQDKIYVLEVNPRASRTVPFISKATGIPLAKVAALCMLGKTLVEQGRLNEVVPDFYSVKQPIFPFIKFPDVDPILGPEMKSTGEVMGIAKQFGEAFSKAQLGAGNQVPESGVVLLSVREADKPRLPEVGRALIEAGYRLIATEGTANTLHQAGLSCDVVNKVRQGHPHVVDMIENHTVDMIVNTTEGAKEILDSYTIRRSAVQNKICYFTTLAGIKAVCVGLSQRQGYAVNRLQKLLAENS